MLHMSPNYEPEFKKKIDCLHLEEGRSSKGLQLNMEYQKQAYPIGQNNSVMNVRQMKKLKPIMTTGANESYTSSAEARSRI